MAVRILYDPQSDLSTTTISAESKKSNSLVETNVVDNRIGKPWRTNNTVTGVWIKFDQGASGFGPNDAVGIFGHNLTSAAVVTVEANATDSWGSPTFTEVLGIQLDDDGLVFTRIVEFITATTLRFWRITIEDGLNGDGYIQIGRIMLGQYYEIPRAANQGLRVETIDPSEGTNAPGEVPVLTQKALFRRLNIGFSFLTQAITDKFETIFSFVGNSKPVLIGWDETAGRQTKDSMYAFMITGLDWTNTLITYADVASIVFEEKTR
jgi:hypothetical protein